MELGPKVAHGLWNHEESCMSSTWRELKAIENVLQSFASLLQGQVVKWFTDNQAVVSIVEVGSGKPHLQLLALSVQQICIRHNMRMELDWVPRSKNEQADAFSRIMDHDDWSLNPAVFQQLDRLWGAHTLDCFANSTRKDVSLSLAETLNKSYKIGLLTASYHRKLI